MTEQLEDDVETKDIGGTFCAPSGRTARFRIGWESGDVFREDDDFEGYTLTVELSEPNEGQAVISAAAEAAVLSAQLETERRRSEGLRAGLRNLYFKSSAMQVGIGVHNARHKPKIEGPIVSEFSDAVQAARAILEDTTDADQ